MGVDKRQEVINKLKENHKVQCPKCKCQDFRKTSTELVSINIDEGSNLTGDEYIEYLGNEKYVCNDCGRKLKEKDFK